MKVRLTMDCEHGEKGKVIEIDPERAGAWAAAGKSEVVIGHGRACRVGGSRADPCRAAAATEGQGPREGRTEEGKALTC